jgi:integrase
VKDNVTKRGKTWSYYVELPPALARDCDGAPRRHRVWVDEHDGDDCPRCSQPLGPAQQRRRPKWVGGFATAKEAKTERRRVLGVLDAGGDAFPPDITLREFVESAWLPHLAANDKPRASTREGYEKLLRRWVLPEIGGLRLDRITPAHCQAVLRRMIEAGKAPRTIRHARAALSSAFTQALRWRLVQVNPVKATSAPTVQPPELRIPTIAEVRVLIDAARETPWEIPTLIAGTTGARRSEALGVRWANVDLDAGRVRIVDTIVDTPRGLAFAPPKTKQSVRPVPIPAFAVERLRAHKADQARRRLALGEDWSDLDLVCDRGDGRPLDPMSFTHGFARIADKVGLGKVRLHDLRHAIGTSLAKSGTPLTVTSRLLGHTSTAFTAQVYQHADEEMIERAARGLEDAFGV